MRQAVCQACLCSWSSQIEKLQFFQGIMEWHSPKCDQVLWLACYGLKQPWCVMDWNSPGEWWTETALMCAGLKQPWCDGSKRNLSTSDKVRMSHQSISEFTFPVFRICHRSPQEATEKSDSKVNKSFHAVLGNRRCTLTSACGCSVVHISHQQCQDLNRRN